MKKIIVSFFLFYIFALLQTSFLAPLNIFGIIPNFILIIVVLLNLLELPFEKSGCVISFLGGFYLDIFSFENYGFFGFRAFILLFFSLSLKYFLSRYVRFPAIKKI